MRREMLVAAVSRIAGSASDLLLQGDSEKMSVATVIRMESSASDLLLLATGEGSRAASRKSAHSRVAGNDKNNKHKKHRYSTVQYGTMGREQASGPTQALTWQPTIPQGLQGPRLTLAR